MSALRRISMGISALVAMAWLFCGSAAAQQQTAKPESQATAASSNEATAGGGKLDDAELRVEGEKRFHANCGRCHQAPQKFPPRMMATIVRHMRVRATLTQKDMQAILAYMTQ